MTHSFNKHDITRDACMLRGPLRRQGYDWWWHSLTARDESGAEKPFFIEFFVCNPDLAEDEPVLGQLPANAASGTKPSYLMVKAGCWGEDMPPTATRRKPALREASKSQRRKPQLTRSGCVTRER